MSHAAHLNVFLFAGQSNIWGQDALCDGTGTTAQATLGNGILDLVGLGTQQAADAAALLVASYPYDTGITVALGDIRGHNGYSYGQDFDGLARPYKVCGSEIGFSRQLYAANWRNIAILKFASNYTALEGGRSAWVSPGTRWVAWQSFVTAQLAALVSTGHSYTIIGVVWHQGIDDMILHRSQAAYEADLIQMIAETRAAYGATLPFVLARNIASSIAGAPYTTQVRAGQVAVGSSGVPNGWITVDDATLVNTHHIRASSHLTIGARFADLLMTLAGPYADKAAMSGLATVTGTAALRSP